MEPTISFGYGFGRREKARVMIFVSFEVVLEFRNENKEEREDKGEEEKDKGGFCIWVSSGIVCGFRPN